VPQIVDGQVPGDPSLVYGSDEAFANPRLVQRRAGRRMKKDQIIIALVKRALEMEFEFRGNTIRHWHGPV
jgi:hypothetical protein